MLVARWLLPAMAVAIRGICVLLHIIRLLISAYTPVPPLANLSTRSGEHTRHDSQQRLVVCALPKTYGRRRWILLHIIILRVFGAPKERAGKTMLRQVDDSVYSVSCGRTDR